MKEKLKVQKITEKIIGILQLIVSIVFLVLVWNTGLLPVKYLLLLTGGLIILAAAVFASQYIGKARIPGLIMSVLISIALIIGSFYVYKAKKLMADVGGATYKTDNMIVVVKNKSSAENLLDAKQYRFGIQTSVDQSNTEKMITNINEIVERTIKVEEYDTVQELATALLEGRVEAAVYNQALEGILAESDDEIFEDYSDKVKVLYRYGIDTEMLQEESSVEEPFNVYISGIDVNGPITTNSRSDVNIIMTVNPNTKQIVLTTTPRDYYVQIPNISGEQRDKLTHAGIYGVDASMSTLEALYGIEISYYARVNFTSLITIVDTLGGVDVDSDYDFTAGGYHYVKGVNHLNGEQALAFSRERYSFKDGDNQRGKNQEKVLTAILNKAMSPAILTNASSIIASVSDCVQTNMTQEEMAKFINMQLSDGASWSIQSQAATGRGDKRSCYSSGSQLLYVMWPNVETVQNLSAKMQEVLGEE